MKNKITIYEIAKKASMSVATISRALNPETRDKVAAETRLGIDKLVQRYGYTPNMAARHLRKTSYQTIGILFPHHEGIFLSEYYSQILSGVADQLLGSDYYLKMVLLKPKKPKWDAYDFKAGEGVDGLIVTYWRTFFSNASVLENLNVPCTIISNFEKDVKAHFVSGDHFQGGQIAAEHLYSHGHKKIAVLTGAGGAADAQQRLDGFRSFLAQKNIRLGPNSIFDVQFKEEEAYKFTETLLNKRPDITAIFCMNDTLALGVLKKLKELGIDCPKKISVIGYDNDRRSEHASPSLTTIQVPVYEAAKKATEHLIQYLSDKDAKRFFYTHEMLPASLVERKSVRVIG